MAVDIFALLDRLEDLLANATRVPLTGKVMVDPDEALAVVDEMRELLPEEIRQAGRVTEEKERILEAARAEAEALVRDAKVYAGQLTDESAIARDAQEKAEEAIEQAKRVAREIRAGALDYAEDVLHKVEQSLERAYTTVKKSREELQR